MTNVLVVGGAGYIGGTLTDQLIAAGYNTRVYDNLLFEERYLKPVDFICGDVRDQAKLAPHMKWADTVVWLVGLVGDGACGLYPDLTEELNVESVKWLAANFDRRIIFMSTCSVYGAQDGLLTEASPFNPRTVDELRGALAAVTERELIHLDMRRKGSETIASLTETLVESGHKVAELSAHLVEHKRALREAEAAHLEQKVQAKTLAEELEEITGALAVAERRIESLGAECDTQRRTAATLRINSELMERLLGQIDGAFTELLGSSRWRIGNWLGEWKRVLSRRPPTPLASDFIVDRLRTFRQWETMSLDETAGPAAELVLGGIAPAALGPAEDNDSPRLCGLPEAMSLAPPVTVVIPVFNAADVLEVCLDSVVRNTGGAELLIINDASTDPAISALLERYAGHPAVRILHNERNLGFTRTVNRALAETVGDVVLLNSDTVVPPRWLQNLRLAAYARAGVGTVTAVSDNAGAFSVPEPGRRTNLPAGVDNDSLGRTVMQASTRIWAELPTGNGFCLYVRRAVIEAIGGFDAEHFPRGYGEENDFCMRALKAGFRHVVDETTFVQHHEGQSFGAERQRRLDEGMTTLGGLYPEYGALVAGAFDAPGRLQGWRRAGKAIADAARRGAGRIRVLAILHQAVGGMPKTAMEIAIGLEPWFETLILTSDSLNLRLFTISDGELRQIESLRLSRPINDWRQPDGEYASQLSQILLEYAIELIHLHHLASHSLDIFSTARLLDIPVVVTLHDFFMLCPTVHLLDDRGQFCGGTCTPTPGDCRSPFAFLAGIAGLKHGWLTGWRQTAAQILGEAAQVVVNHDWVSQLHKQHLSRHLTYATVPLGSPLTQRYGIVAAPDLGQPLRILCVGNIDIHKGARFIHDLAAQAPGQIEFHFAGRAAPLLDTSGKHWGAYGSFDQLAAIARDVRPQFIGIFSIWSETWCHVMTEAWALGVPVLIFEIGVQAERLREHGGGWVIPVEPSLALKAIRAIANNSEEWQRQVELARLTGTPNLTDMTTGYDEVYRQALRSRLTFIPEQRRPLLRVALLPQYVGPAPTASAFLRLLGPLAHPILRPEIALRQIEVSRLPAILDRTDVLIVQRVALPPEMVPPVVAACRAKGVKLVLETDDDLFAIGPDHPEYAYYGPRLAGLRQLADQADMLVASTEVVASALASLDRPVTVIPNTLDEMLWLRPSVPPATRRVGIIGYVGTATHAADLDILRQAVNILSKRGLDVSVEVVGGEPEAAGQGWYRRVLIPAGDEPYPRFVPWLRRAAAQWDIGVAPLVPTAFNAGKSHLKYVEYSALGLAGVYADLPAYRAHVRHGETGLLAAADPTAWADMLELLIRNRTLRDHLAAQAREDILARHLHAHAAQRWRSLFHSLMGR